MSPGPFSDVYMAGCVSRATAMETNRELLLVLDTREPSARFRWTLKCVLRGGHNFSKNRKEKKKSCYKLTGNFRPLLLPHFPHRHTLLILFILFYFISLSSFSILCVLFLFLISSVLSFVWFLTVAKLPALIRVIFFRPLHIDILFVFYPHLKYILFYFLFHYHCIKQFFPPHSLYVLSSSCMFPCISLPLLPTALLGFPSSHWLPCSACPHFCFLLSHWSGQGSALSDLPTKFIATLSDEPNPDTSNFFNVDFNIIILSADPFLKSYVRFICSVLLSPPISPFLSWSPK